MKIPVGCELSKRYYSNLCFNILPPTNNIVMTKKNARKLPCPRINRIRSYFEYVKHVLKTFIDLFLLHEHIAFLIFSEFKIQISTKYFPIHCMIFFRWKHANMFSPFLNLPQALSSNSSQLTCYHSCNICSATCVFTIRFIIVIFGKRYFN